MDALYHPYLEEGRIRYHTFLCTCCHNAGGNGTRQFCRDLEPNSPKTFDPSYERELTTTVIAKGTHTYMLCTYTHHSHVFTAQCWFYIKFVCSSHAHTARLQRYIRNVNPHHPPLFINTCSKQFQQFQK